MWNYVFVVLFLTSNAYSQQVPALFIFGDSLVDNGNNNGILSLASANYMPYGIDFPQGTTGRFTNGRTFVDVLAQLLGLPNYIPSYASARGRVQSLLTGANYASGASGIRDETGNNLGGHMSMNQQVNTFARTVQQLRRYFRDENALATYLSKSIFYCGLGSNDYLNNYFMRDYYTTSTRYTPKAYADSLIQDYSRQLTTLYNLGARKVIVAGVGQIGCIPYQLARYTGKGSSKCNEEINSAIVLFNSNLRYLVDRFNKGPFGAKFVYLDAYQGSQDVARNAKAYGFEVVDTGCCGVGRNNGQITCLPFQTPCQNRRNHLFWDAFHPTEAANVLIANKVFTDRSKLFAYPINIQQLAML